MLLPWQQRRELCATADGAGEKCRGEGGDEGGDGEVWERCGVGRGHGRVTMPVCRTEGPEGGGLRGGRGVLRAGSDFLRVLRAGSEFFLSSSSGERDGFPMLSLRRAPVTIISLAPLGVPDLILQPLLCTHASTANAPTPPDPQTSWGGPDFRESFSEICGMVAKARKSKKVAVGSRQFCTAFPSRGVSLLHRPPMALANRPDLLVARACDAVFVLCLIRVDARRSVV